MNLRCPNDYPKRLRIDNFDNLYIWLEGFVVLRTFRRHRRCEVPTTTTMKNGSTPRQNDARRGSDEHSRVETIIMSYVPQRARRGRCSCMSIHFRPRNPLLVPYFLMTPNASASDHIQSVIRESSSSSSSPFLHLQWRRRPQRQRHDCFCSSC